MTTARASISGASAALASSSQARRWPPAWPLALGLALLYLPTYWDFLFGYWAVDSQGHELLVVAISAWLMQRRFGALRALPGTGRPLVGAVLLLLGLAAYVVGRQLSQLHVNSRIELSSLFVVLLAVLLAYRGWRALNVAWFPLLFLLFAMPLPASFVTALTMPLKQAVSASAVSLLGLLDYPVGRSGVMITIGQYQLLVAEACAGLQTLFTLEAVGLLYVNLMDYKSPWRTVLMSVLAVPAAFAANVVRVVILILVTYHFGDAVGQGFVHGFAGIVLFVVALGLLIALDRLLQPVFGSGRGAALAAPAPHAAADVDAREPLSRRVALGFGLAMGASAALAALRAPHPGHARSVPTLDLDRVFPKQAGPWTLDQFGDVFIRPSDERSKVYGVYDQVLERIYVGPGGARVMLCVAYGARQSDRLHVHRPENCYRGAGFEVSRLTRVEMALADHAIPASRLLAIRPGRVEPITYWTVFGSHVENDPRDVNWIKLRAGLRGEILDGMLIRVSTIDRDPDRAYRLQAAFADALVRAIDPGYRMRVIGA